MEQEHLLILDMLDEGKITVPEALSLIEVVDENEPEFFISDPGEETITILLYLN